MRIFFPSAAEYLTDTQANGEGLIAWNLLSELAARGHEIVACVRGQDVIGPPDFEILQIGRCGSFESLDAVAYSRAIAATLRDRGTRSFDLAHWLFPNGAPGLSPTALGGLPFVVGPLVQPWAAQQRWWPPGFTAQRALRPWLARRQARMRARANAILVVDDAARRDIAEVASDRVHRVPFGVRVDRFGPQPLPLTPRILYLGRLERRKGIYDLLSTMPRILAALPAATLTVAGTGPEQDGLRDAASRLGVVNAVDFVGRVAVPAVPALLSSSSLLCLPSHGEPFGMVLLEAMAAGRTVVATRVGGPASIVVDGAGGALVEPGDVSQLAAALIALLSSRARLDSAGEFNRARAESRYSLDSVVDRIERIYESVA